MVQFEAVHGRFELHEVNSDELLALPAHFLRIRAVVPQPSSSMCVLVAERSSISLSQV
jgi:hypothetical protein